MSFQPTQIPGCQVWLDGADSSSLTLVGSSVSQWNDKSGLGNNATQTVAGNRPVYNSASGNIGFTATSSQFLNLPNGALPTGNTSYAYFIVCTWAQIEDGLGVIGGGNYTTGNASFYLKTFNFNGGIDHAWTGNSLLIAANAYTANVPLIVEATYTSGGARATLINGTQRVTDNPGTRSQTNANNTVGASIITGTTPLYHDGTISEVIVFNASLTTNQRQQVEGYLAWKWGLQSRLPTTQPYRFFPPTSLTVQSATEFNMIRTNVQPGTLALPAASTIPGRILTFKDISGTFFNNPFTLSTVGIDRFENGANLKRLIEPFGYLTVASDGISKWYSLDGTSLNTYTIGSLTNTIQTSTNTISTGNMAVSTLGLIDQFFRTNNQPLLTRSTLLYLGSNVIGGSKVGPTLFLPVSRQFQPNQISGLSLWLDASDPNTIITQNNTVLNLANKTGVTRNFSNTNPNKRPIYSQQNASIYFNGIDSAATGMILDGPNYVGILSNPSSFSIFVVGKPNSVNTNDPEPYYDDAIIGDSGGYQCIFFRTGLAGAYIYDSNNQVKQVTLPYTPGSRTLFSYSLQDSLLSFFINGGTPATVAATLPIKTSGIVSALQLGGQYVTVQGFQYLNCDLNEVLIYGTLTVSQRQQIEGYLAWKWGLVGDLPSNHPFKNSPP